ncbi:DNA primase subunit [Synechococcus phage ACG-2014b]|uniref:DNA primase subunit n=2 Tax=Synechococcus phage ACG-2014b TaxID=1493508 RepID=A0A0E3EUT5_9CAUD|nr:DNA primase [Synechococcus phage ACG-2014b]YP_009779797.1 DNA primase [Synechococcus phage ACG-2014b]YP_009780015.1 DNA primase [Synechococcus phage ACG-2014b]AIX17391.1 DNA primase subunit [Synechococcus phage ACG-2014b]AIX17606.1 DNA primase subunit [Synechococcus phage ACG-2014b]AIX17822.1 DNA primase subunit [Synechococcus phage ACG-2014b]AIX18038.1 DNA primase subunit [Synechococcus phage ACG-2014b]AIX18253.1 DNA primase subunit [Synechococcus phage ACG-2014b]
MIDEQFARLISSRLDKFKQIKNGTYTFRCPYCGDSQKYRNKTRGYFFTKNSGLVFKCHNCGVGRSFGNFIKDNANDVYDEYVMERYKNGLTGKGRNVADPTFKTEKPKFKKKGELHTIEQLNNQHPAVGYLQGRQIPEQHFSNLFYTDKFCTWVNTQKPTFKDVKKDHPRIIIPFIDTDGTWFGFQGRSLNPTDKMRYITIMLDESKTKIFGLNRVNFNKTIYITEGPFDSFYIDNAIAMAGADVDWDVIRNKEVVFVYDNEKRNKEIVDRMHNAIDKGYEIVIWPENLQEKDLNDMFIAGHDVQSLVEFNTYSGLQAQIKLSEWKKV